MAMHRPDSVTTDDLPTWPPQLLPTDQRRSCVQHGCGLPLVWSNRHHWLHDLRPAQQQPYRMSPGEQQTLRDSDQADHPPRAFGPPTLPPVDPRPSVLMHDNCPVGHSRLGDVRRCTGRFVQLGVDVRRVHLDA
jgi:hypothetical protein